MLPEQPAKIGIVIDPYPLCNCVNRIIGRQQQFFRAVHALFRNILGNRTVQIAAEYVVQMICRNMKLTAKNLHRNILFDILTNVFQNSICQRIQNKKYNIL